MTRATVVTVVADLDLCQAHQMCQLDAPEVFGFDADADKVTVLDPHPRAELRPSVDRAVRFCPAMALSVVESVAGPAEEG